MDRGWRAVDREGIKEDDGGEVRRKEIERKRGCSVVGDGAWWLSSVMIPKVEVTSFERARPTGADREYR